ncbi:hypothetical protein GCM10023185_19360 [Hymenobacter saemangeumensis]|uniref:Uncharacterized protein n=2 Tax=Hymenobacter saemangeumensis TaxID=1084522 RepID=A0ABP8IC93_9BACT
MEHYDAWCAVLKKADVDREFYLWHGTACAYPGIRRKVGKNDESGATGKQNLSLDKSGNQMGHRPWELLHHTGADFRRMRQGYELVHLFPHKADEWKKLLPLLPDEIQEAIPAEWHTRLKVHGLPGLFSNPANTCFLPSALVRPTDGQSLLRQVLWKQAMRLYGSTTLLPCLVAKAFKQWLRGQHDPTGLVWNCNFHGDPEQFVKLQNDRVKKLTVYQQS